VNKLQAFIHRKYRIFRSVATLLISVATIFMLRVMPHNGTTILALLVMASAIAPIVELIDELWKRGYGS